VRNAISMASENNKNNVADYLKQQLKDAANLKLVSKEGTISKLENPDVISNISDFTGVAGKKHKTKKHKTKKKRQKDKKKKPKKKTYRRKRR